MLNTHKVSGLETKFCSFDDQTGLKKGSEIAGYASVFGAADQGGDQVKAGAYTGALSRITASGRRVKMLWQHDPTRPIGVWDEVREDEHGLFVKGRILTDVQLGKEAVALIKAGAIDGLSIGYRTLRAEKAPDGARILHELELWEVSLVTFPMLPEARVECPADAADAELASELVDALGAARSELLAQAPA